ncbi:MAG: phosphoglycerate mutase [Candidatus Staskawiczbacteria bacterium]|nr:phosphoglycerate mutase [Candidatus Staskawiczbacteria bacterium]
MKLLLLRHLKSQWNKDDRFAGWVDNPLSDEGRLQAKGIFEQLKNQKIDVAYCNALIRCTETVLRIFEDIPGKYPLFLHIDGGKMQKWGNFEGTDMGEIPFYVTEKLNERYYGSIQGLNKAKTKEKHGEVLVQEWRRSFNGKPAGGESLKDVCKRVDSFFKKYIEKDLKQNKNILVVASHNSLRAMVKYIENIPDEDIVNLELPFGALVEYEYSDGKFMNLHFKK